MTAIWDVFARNWCLPLLSGKNGSFNGHAVCLMTTEKTVIKLGLITWCTALLLSLLEIMGSFTILSQGLPI